MSPPAPLATPPADAADQRYRTPAWLMSLVAHLVVLLVGALLLQGSEILAPPPPERSVGIVLADMLPSGAVEYFAEDDAQDSAAPAPNAPLVTAETSQGSSASEATPLPASEIALPEDLLGAAPLAGLPGDGPTGPTLRVAGRPTLLPGLGDAEILAAEAARAQAVGTPGPQTRMSLFGGAPAVGNSFAFVIDRSQSMGGEGLNALAAAEKELNAQLAKLTPEHKFQIMAYNQATLYLTQPGLLPATDENRVRAAKFLNGLVAYAGTQHEMALMAALRLKADVVFVLSDGGDPPLNPAEIARVTERNRGQSAIHCIVFGEGPPGDVLPPFAELARRNGGSCGYVDMRGGR